MTGAYLLFFNLIALIFGSGEPGQTERWLVEITPGGEQCLSAWVSENPLRGNATMRKLPLEGWYAFQLTATKAEQLRHQSCVLRVDQDRKIEWRDNVPNDPAYHNQADMKLIGMAKAWDISTGGLTSRGDTIVVALIDDGFETTNFDLAPNLYYNYGEIPDDGIDNDGNDYVDDYKGYNVSTANDHHPSKPHGTSVAAIAGARGNDGIGVTGVNWKVKLMLISGADFESELIEAYQYVIDQRKAYNNSHGTKGAFVVAANLSGGVNGEFAVDHPMWCQMYDKLGEAGVLGVCAAPNSSISVDVDGDMPTTCTSSYMVAVTNVDATDQLVGNAGFGSTSIDIGAPGHGTITTSLGNVIKEFTGTSSATPHVTGAIALLYSTPCVYFLQDIDDHPERVAERARDILFSSAKPNNSLKDVTVTGKRLQVDAAMIATMENCGPIPEDGMGIDFIGPNPVHLEDARVQFHVSGDTATAFFELYTPTGMKVAHLPISAEEFASGELSLPTSSLPAGIYYLTLRNQKKKSTRSFFVY